MTTLQFPLLLIASFALWILGLLLLGGSSDVGVAFGAVLLGLGAVIGAYAWWYALAPEGKLVQSP